MTAPAIAHEGLPSTPAEEWAEKTTASLSPESVMHSSHPDDVTGGHRTITPGPQLPGAYPGDFGSFAAEDAKNAAVGVIQTAKQYIPTQQDVEKAMLSASETAKQYLPNSVASYLPSSPKPKDQDILETGGDDLLKEHAEGGVASDPIPRSPNGMNGTARMPRTDVDSFRSSTTVTTNFSTQAQAGSDAATPIPSVASPSNSRPDTFASDAEETDPTSTSQHALVSDKGRKPSETVSGVKTVQEVTRDDQLAQQPVLHTEPRAYPLAKQGGGSHLHESAGSLENEPSAGGIVNLKDETLPVKGDTQNTTNHTTSDIQPAIQPNINSGPGQPDKSHVAHNRDGSAISDTSVVSRTESGPSSGSPNRSKFLDKVKGEVKVISGKLAHNEGKVEEGRRLMGKTV